MRRCGDGGRDEWAAVGMGRLWVDDMSGGMDGVGVWTMGRGEGQGWVNEASMYGAGGDDRMGGMGRGD